MAYPVFFQGSNKVLNAPKGMEDEVTPLPVLDTTQQIISCWKLTPEEIAYVNERGLVWFSIGVTGTHPPIRLAAEAMVTYEGFHPEIKDTFIAKENKNG